jgi:RIO-like serine/threonine protein kinase
VDLGLGTKRRPFPISPQGIVHRDLKPGNILLGAARELYIADFGLARRASGEATRQFGGTVPRDLETICLQCLEKTPSRRYATAGALADDLRR